MSLSSTYLIFFQKFCYFENIKHSYCFVSDFIKGVPMKLNDKFQPLPTLRMVDDVSILFPESIFDEEVGYLWKNINDSLT